MLHAVAHLLGLTNASGGWYLWWSGIGSDITEFALLGIVWKRLNCHAAGCWRLGIHKVDGTHYVTCRTHHPGHAGTRAHTAQEIADAHRRRNR